MWGVGVPHLHRGGTAPPRKVWNFIPGNATFRVHVMCFWTKFKSACLLEAIAPCLPKYATDHQELWIKRAGHWLIQVYMENDI